MYILPGWFGHFSWYDDNDYAYAVVEFTITQDSPMTVPFISTDLCRQPGYVEFVEYSNATPYGMTVVVKNTRPSVNTSA